MTNNMRVVLSIVTAIAACAVKEYVSDKIAKKMTIESIKNTVKTATTNNSTSQVKTIRVTPDSDAEKELMKYVQFTKDGIVCRIGALFGWKYNEYDLTQADIDRIVEAGWSL